MVFLETLNRNGVLGFDFPKKHSSDYGFGVFFYPPRHADIPYRSAFEKLAEQHRYQVRPSAKIIWALVSLFIFCLSIENSTIKFRYNLRE